MLAFKHPGIFHPYTIAIYITTLLIGSLLLVLLSGSTTLAISKYDSLNYEQYCEFRKSTLAIGKCLHGGRMEGASNKAIHTALSMLRAGTF